MGNKVITKTSFNIMNDLELKEFLSSISVIDGFFGDTNLTISSKCLVIINNLLNHLSSNSFNIDANNELHNYQCIDISPGISIPFDKESLDVVNKLKCNYQQIRHLSIFNSNMKKVEEYIELNNFVNLVSLDLENLPIRFVQHLKLHRESLLKLCVHNCISDLASLIELCGGDHSFSGSWSNLLHLDIRFNKLRAIDSSVSLLTNLSVIDVSRNDLESIDFVERIPTLVCLNASYNCIKVLPKIRIHPLKVLIIGYNYLERLYGIGCFKSLTTLNASFNMISSSGSLSDIDELVCLEDFILKGNPIHASVNYRISVLNVISALVTINFTLDGCKFTNKERVYLQKRPIIVIKPSAPTEGNSSNHIQKIKPLVRNFDLSPSLNGRSPRKPVRFVTIDGKKPEVEPQKYVPTNEKKIIDEIHEKNVNDEKVFSQSDETDCNDSTFSDLSTIKYRTNIKPFYLGKHSSNLISIYDKKRESFVKVSLQIFEHKFMAVDENCKTVDNIDLWTLLYVNHEGYSGNVLKLVFYKEMLSDPKNAMKIIIRLLEFSDLLEANIFFDQVKYYLGGFSIKFDENVNNAHTVVFMKCSECLLCYQFNSNKYRPIFCSVECQSKTFKIFTYDTRTANQLFVPREEKNGGLSPGKFSRNTKLLTSDIVIKAITSDNDSEAGTSYQTALNSSFRNPSTTSLLNSPYDSILDVSIQEEKSSNDDDSSTESGINLDKPIVVIPPELDSIDIIPNLPFKNEELQYINSFIKSDWIVNEPLSNVQIYMDNVTKIDDRIKIHFLTNVMLDDEELIAVVKANVIYKTSVATEALMILSNTKIRFYNWVDKNSNSFEDCIKLLVEFKCNTLLEMNDCLNHQWINLIFKKKQYLSLLIGDHKTTKNVVGILSNTVCNVVSKLLVHQLKGIGSFNCPQIIEDMARAFNEDKNKVVESNYEYYLIKSTSFMKNDILDNEYVPKLIGFQSEHIFFINVKVKTKPFQFNFELNQTLSLYVITNKITVSQNNPCHCQLNIFENNTPKHLDIEFMSPAARSNALLYFNRLWTDLYQTSIEFQLT